ncbi:MAG: D-alanyl-D-alanine carboxypeptidase [Anaerolineae bacterium]|nr:D-alanyl-D-alanine carboxypeptidase [Anaerolineae bacterium]
MRAVATWFLVLIAGWSGAGFGPPIITDGRQGGWRLFPEHVRAIHALARPPAVTAASALAIELDAGQTLYSYRPDEPWPPASTAKLMTALVVVHHVDINQRVVVSSRAAATPGSRMGLTAGETLTVGDLLYGLLLPSGNDAAVALAEHVAGNETAFVGLMNERAAALGLRGTRFVNAHGSDAPGQVTTASDLVLLARAVLAHPLLARIVARPSAQVAGRTLKNTNELLGAYPYVDGVKTGTTDAAGECLVASATRDGHRLIVVVLGSRDRYADARALLDFALGGWQWQNMRLPDNALAWTDGPDGMRYRLRSAVAPDLFLPRWQWSLVQPVRVIDAAVPLTSTLPVGTLTWTFAGQSLAVVPLTVWFGP